MTNRVIPYDKKKVERLAHIDEIYRTTRGWTVQLMNLYEERKRLRIDVSRMEKPDGGHSANYVKRPKNPYRRSNMGSPKVW